MTPTAMPPPSGIEAVSSAPARRRWLSAEKSLQQPVLDDDRQAEGDEQRRQDVAPERAVEQHVLQARSRATNMTGSAISAAANGSRPSLAATSRIAKAASTMRSPWARLTSRMMPKISDSPVANSA